jgi:crotonobetainyl-CoA:carnitine CoA-transferase CaiB-like acyl-CoA transferase
MRQAVEHPQVEPRELVARQTHPAIGAIETLGPVVKLSRTPAAVTLPPPVLGEHTAEILERLKAERQDGRNSRLKA